MDDVYWKLLKMMKYRYIILNIRGKLVWDGVYYKENMFCYSNMMLKY